MLEDGALEGDAGFDVAPHSYAAAVATRPPVSPDATAPPDGSPVPKPTKPVDEYNPEEAPPMADEQQARDAAEALNGYAFGEFELEVSVKPRSART